MSKHFICDSGFRAVCQSEEIWSSSGCSSVRGTHPIMLLSSADFFDPRCFADPDFSNSQKWLLGNIKLLYLIFDHLLIAFATCFFAGVVSCARQNNLSDEALRVWPFYLGIQTPAVITNLEWHRLCLMLTEQSCLFPVNTCLSEKPHVLCWAGACALPKFPVCESSLGRPGWEPPEHDASMDITVMASGIIGAKGEFFIKLSWKQAHY